MHLSATSVHTFGLKAAARRIVPTQECCRQKRKGLKAEHLSSHRCTSHQEFTKRSIPRQADVAGFTTISSASMAVIPTWEELTEQAKNSFTGQRISEQEALRAQGGGLPHTDAKLRLFGQSEADVRLTLYRDHAAWCPYCQKVWMLIEEKQIPCRIEKINMRSYGDKPQWFLQKVPSGLLPVIELDGKMITESLVIMQILEQEFPGTTPMIPSDPKQFARCNKLLKLERQLFGDWCNLTFRPSIPGPFGGGPKKSFMKTMDQVEKELGVEPGPWFCGGDTPSLVDLQYVSHVERMVASVLYWKGIKIRGGEATKRWPNIERWFDAFEQRPSYWASKSDYFTHVRDIPPQYGPGIQDNTPEAVAAMREISGEGSAWRLPLDLGPESLQPVSPYMSLGEEEDRHEAALKLTGNHTAVARFACRGAGEEGRKRFQAPLADPYAVPNEELQPDVEKLLLATTMALLKGVEATQEVSEAVVADVRGGGHGKESARCLAYLRERVGVPRDMSYGAAMQFRAHLNHFIDLLVA